MNAQTSRDTSGTLRTSTGVAGAGQFATEKKAEQSITRLVRTAPESGADRILRRLELQSAVDDATAAYAAAHQENIDVRMKGGNRRDSTLYPEFIRTEKAEEILALDEHRATWDLKSFHLDNARELVAVHGPEHAAHALRRLQTTREASDEDHAIIQAAAEDDEKLARDYLRSPFVGARLRYDRHDPGRHIFLDHSSENIRFLAVEHQVAGYDPEQLSELLSAHEDTDGCLASYAQNVLRQSGYPRNRVRHNGDLLHIGDYTFIKAEAAKLYELGKSKPNRVHGIDGPIYPE
jgi:hypothetical protein